MPKQSIPEKHEQLVLKKAGEGWSTRKIADWLKRDHKVRCTHTAVGRLLRRLREDRSVTSQAVAREKLAEHVTGDLDILGKQQLALERVAVALARGMVDKDGEGTDLLTEKIGNTPRAIVLANVVGRLESLTARKLELAGAGNTQGNAGAAGPTIYTPAESDD